MRPIDIPESLDDALAGHMHAARLLVRVNKTVGQRFEIRVEDDAYDFAL